MPPLVTVLLLLVAAAAATSAHVRGDTDIIPHLSHIYENRTEGVTELLLVRQEIRLNQLLQTETAAATTLTGMAKTLIEIRDALQGVQMIKEVNDTCEAPYSQAGSHCLLLALGNKVTWSAASHFCTARGGQLVTFSDANTYSDYLAFVNDINPENLDVSAWVGGTDEDLEGVWRWTTGELMPRGPPFWGSTNGYKPEPSGGRAENCGILYRPDKYYLHDIRCDFTAAPFCQKISD